MIDIQMYILIQKWPFWKFTSVAQFVHNKTTFPCSSWCMDACSVYSITTRKCRVVLTQCGQSSKATQTNHSYLCFALNFLLPGKKETQLADWKCYIHQQHPQTMQGGRGAADPQSFESAVGWGRGEMVGPEECIRGD